MTKALKRMSMPKFFGYLIAVGALSGLLAWCLVLVGRLAIDGSRPTLLSLMLAIPRGSLFALILGCGLRIWWRIRRDTKGNQQKP